MPWLSGVQHRGARLLARLRDAWAPPSPVAWLTIAGAMLLMLWPALLNGFPIVFFDTGGYIETAVLHKPVEGRSLAYGLFLQATSLNWRTLWGPVVAQAALTLWLLHQLRAGLTPGGDPGRIATLALVLLLSLCTGMAWYTAQLMPDLTVPWVVATLWLLAFRWDSLTWTSRLGIAAVGLLSLLSHMSGMALGIGLVGVLGLMKAIGGALRPRSWRALRLLPPAALVAGSVMALPLLNGVVTGQATLTPGGPLFLFGSLLQQGHVRRLLDERCADDPHAYALCPLRHRLPTTADEFLWGGDSPLVTLGGWQAMTPEAARLNAAVMRRYPIALALSSLQAGLEQFFRVQTGDGLDEYHGGTREVMHLWLARLEPAYLKADQQNEGPTPGMADLSNYLAVPLAYVALAMLAALIPQAVRRRDGVALGALLFLWAALAGNALICGALSNPHDRYQNRLVWLVPVFALALNSRLRALAGVEAEPAIVVPNAPLLPGLLRRRWPRIALPRPADAPALGLRVPEIAVIDLTVADLAAVNLAAEQAPASLP
ncbi:hypothetical protein [Nitrospirillum iridis]|uniref:Glycosyltransferase RgtA/B/C/D-like domain-containing protein n=1 Tax=Nitrospirillum iridis TaxID=765888 RepID=A0A7X0B0T6_9PROT|nr:hypothetical protein [Nitrospirillum iridis]MBB6252881.1 hypothetical protein [Nitrospirillum iridis]